MMLRKLYIIQNQNIFLIILKIKKVQDYVKVI